MQPAKRLFLRLRMATITPSSQVGQVPTVFCTLKAILISLPISFLSASRAFMISVSISLLWSTIACMLVSPSAILVMSASKVAVISGSVMVLAWFSRADMTARPVAVGCRVEPWM